MFTSIKITQISNTVYSILSLVYNVSQSTSRSVTVSCPSVLVPSLIHSNLPGPPPLPSQHPPSLYLSVTLPLSPSLSFSPPLSLFLSAPLSLPLSLFLPLCLCLSPFLPFPSRPVPSRPVPSRPVPSRPVPSRPVPSRPVPSRPVPSRPVPFFTWTHQVLEQILLNSPSGKYKQLW